MSISDGVSGRQKQKEDLLASALVTNEDGKVVAQSQKYEIEYKL